MGSKKKAGKRVKKYVPVPETVRPQNFNDLAKGFTHYDREGRQLDIGQTKQCIKYIRWCFEQDPVGMIRLFTKGL